MFRKNRISASEQRLLDLGAQINGKQVPPQSESSASRPMTAASMPKPVRAGRSPWIRRSVIGAIVLLVVLLIAGVSTGGYTLWRYSQIHKVNLSSVLGTSGSGPMTVLLVGSDTRSGLAAGDKKQFGSGAAVAGQRSDTIMLLRIDPSTQNAAILSLPRDLYVNIAGSTHKDRINSSFDNGPQTLIQTIKQDFNISIDHYVEVNFDTFRSVVNTLGGVPVPFATPVRDHDPATGQNLSGLNIPKAGCITLNGDQALSYVRSRHYQILVNGRWQADPLSDLGRIQRQQDFIRRVAHKAVSKGTSNPLTLNALISSGVKNLTVDKGLSLTDMTRLAKRFQSLDPNSIQMMTLPNTPTVIGGADVLLPQQPEADQTISKFLQDSGPTTTTVAASSGNSTATSKSSSSSGAVTTTTAASRYVPSATAAC